MWNTKEKVAEYIEYTVCWWTLYQIQILDMTQRSDGPKDRKLLIVGSNCYG